MVLQMAKKKANGTASAASVSSVLEADESALRWPHLGAAYFLSCRAGTSSLPRKIFAIPWAPIATASTSGWFGSTTAAANEGAPADEGLSYVVHDGKRTFTLRDAVGQEGTRLIGKRLWDTYKRWPVYSKFFDNMGPIPHHMHQNDEQAKLVGQQGKPESYYFPPQLNAVGNNFPYTFFGLEPGTTKEDIRRCLERWNEGDNGILNFSKAYRLQPGTGWLVPPCVLHAPGSLVTYEPQWGSDVFGMYQSMVEGRVVPWELLVKDMPKKKSKDLDFIVGQLDWEGNVDPSFKDHHYLEPIPVADTSSAGYVDLLGGLRQGQRQGAL